MLTSYPALVLATSPALVACETRAALAALAVSLSLVRRTVRLFWFLGTLQKSWAALAAAPGHPRPLTAWLDGFAGSALGLYGLVESATLLDLVGIPGLALFGLRASRIIDREVQVLWLAGLVLDALSCGIKLFHLCAERAPLHEQQRAPADADSAKRLARARARAADMDARIRLLAMKLVAAVLDMAIPAATMRLISVDKGLVAIVMFCSTILTGAAVWDRCAKAVGRGA